MANNNKGALSLAIKKENSQSGTYGRANDKLWKLLIGLDPLNERKKENLSIGLFSFPGLAL